eukprot:SRR837773.14901.p1 GENE.SRR837773.14901~~SRR837773.14901.p1  ORF type:complete len:117 (+),score=32.04 SRR837773.14901:52-351(+)
MSESGQLTIDEFVTGLSTLQEGLATKHMVSIDYPLKRVSLKTGKHIDKLATAVEETLRESQRLSEVVFERQDDTEHEHDELLWQAWKETSAAAKLDAGI